MENTCSNIRRTKCIGVRRVPHFGKWIWCIVFKCLISLPCIFSSCSGVNISVSVYPKGMIKLPYGEPLEILCIAEQYNAEDLEFYWGGKPRHSEIYNATSRRLYIEKPDKQINTFYCRNKVTTKLCANRVLIDSTPMNVTDFSCVSMNLEILNCTWTSPEKFSITNYSLTFPINGNLVHPCVAEKVSKLRYCTWNTSSQPRYKQTEEVFYFQLKACNYFGCNYQNFTVDHFSIVKPDPPSDLKVLVNDTHSVMLQWDIPFNMVDLLPYGVDHRIEYQIAKIDNTSHFRSVDTSGIPPRNKTYRFLLSNLPYAHMQYEVRIYIKSKKAVSDAFWSAFSYIVFYTESERPRRPPDMIEGAFHQASFEHDRRINVYWKQLEEFEEAGENFTYRVVAKIGSRNPLTLYPDKNKSLSYVVLDKASLEAIDVSVWSQNVNGSSYNHSHLYIPPNRDTEALRVPSFTKLAYENGTYKLSWVGVRNIDNYTLFWCQHNSTQICTGRVNFTVLDPKKTIHVINLPRNYKYQFAISANQGMKTSGMVWATCDISKDGIPMYGFPVKVDHDVAGKTSVKLTWKMQCTLQDGIVTGYLISYCPVLDTSSLCDTTLENKSMVYINDSKQMEINITNLKPYRTYQFTLSLNTTYGLKTIENASTGVTTTEDTPTSPRNVSISDILSDSVTIYWDPPQPTNGVIRKYVIFNYDKELHVEKVPAPDNKGNDIPRRHVTLTGLNGFTNYSLSVQACNTAIGSCSKPSPPKGIFVRTRIGPPSMIRAPTISNNENLLKWDPPQVSGGTVDLFQIKRVRDDHSPEILNTTNLSYSLTYCEGVVIGETYQVRAVNFDEDPYHGALADDMEVLFPPRKDRTLLEYPGEWSSATSIACRSKDGITMTLILMAIFVLVGAIYGSIKLYKIYRKREDIKPVLPSGIAIPEKDISKYAFGGWSPTNKDEKPSSDEMLLLPNIKSTASPPNVKQQDNDNNCGSSDHTDSTALSETSRGAVERQVSTSDEGSNASLHLEVEPMGVSSTTRDEEGSINSEPEGSPENSPYLSDKSFKKLPTSGYVQQPIVPASGYVQSAPAPVQISPSKIPPQPASTSYVLATPIFTTGVSQPVLSNQPSTGYVRPEEAQARSMLNFPKMGPSPTKFSGPESLPTMPTLPPPAKHGPDSSYIQLQSLDSMPSHKQPMRTSAPKPAATSGYVSPGDAVINKHLNNILSAGHLEESAILDPAMSPDAYCRFSWSTDPANDNLHSFLADSHTMNKH